VNDLAPIVQVDRRKFIGGSDVPAILGISPYKTATDLWLDKIRPPVEDGRNWAAKARGSRMEPYIVDMIRSEHGLDIVRRNERYIDAELPFMAAEIDAETADGENVEIKTVHPFKSKDWGDLETDNLPLHYLAQVHHGLAVTGRMRCRVFALIGDDLRPYVVDRDEEMVAIIRGKVAEFWNCYVVPRVRPPLDYADRKTLDTLRKLYPGTDGTTVEATAQHEHWRAVYETAVEMARKYEGVIEGARAHLLAEMGAAALLRFDDGMAFRRKLVSVKGRTAVVAPYKFMDFKLVKDKEIGS